MVRFLFGLCVDSYGLYQLECACQYFFTQSVKFFTKGENSVTLKQLLDHYGGSTIAAAHALGYSDQAIRYWIDQGKIPYRAQRLIETVTAGKLIARKERKNG